METKKERGKPLLFEDPQWLKDILVLLPSLGARGQKQKMRDLARFYILVNGENWAKERIVSCYEKYM